jgi:general stress protein YciG
MVVVEPNREATMTDDFHQRGGRVRAEKLSPERKSEIARMGGLARRPAGDLPTAWDEGVLKIGDKQFPCAVLDTKQRVLTQSGVMVALGRARQAKGRQYYDGDVNLPAFLTAKNLKPFIPNELYVTSSQIEFRSKTGGKAFGYPAELLTKICRVFVKADDAKALTKAQKHIAAEARILLEGLEDVAIIALIDEATGYQEKRDKDELQMILAAYIAPSLMGWTERFPKDFFQEMFRVFGWPWPSRPGVPYQGPLGPRYAGKLIRQVIYGNLPPGVLEELERRNPPDAKWQRKSRMGQILTSDIGHPHVEKLVAVVTTLFELSDTKEEFWRAYRRKFKKPGGSQIEMTI